MLRGHQRPQGARDVAWSPATARGTRCCVVTSDCKGHEMLRGHQRPQGARDVAWSPATARGTRCCVATSDRKGRDGASPSSAQRCVDMPRAASLAHVLYLPVVKSCSLCLKENFYPSNFMQIVLTFRVDVDYTMLRADRVGFSPSLHASVQSLCAGVVAADGLSDRAGSVV
jgi:hypothetical protein